MRLEATARPASGDPGAAARTPAILLHGLFGQARNLSGLQRRLSVDRPVWALDLRSHGRSGHAPLSFEAMADDLHETLEDLGLGGRPVCLVGHSLGGKVAMAAALRRPAAVSRLLVADIAPVAYGHANRPFADAMRALALPAGLTRGEADRALAASVADGAVRDLLLQNLDLRPGGPGAPDAPPAWRIGLAEIAGSLAAIEDWPFDGGDARFEGPVLFLRGGRSPYVTDAHTGAIGRLFPRAEIRTMAEAGHWLHAERPDEFAALAGAFLRAGDG